MSALLWPWFLRTVCPQESIQILEISRQIYFSQNLTDIYFFPAGGQAVNSQMERMLTVVPEHIHDRSGIFMGSYDEVQKVIDMHKKHASK
jgi:hypothetical protein